MIRTATGVERVALAVAAFGMVAAAVLLRQAWANHAASWALALLVGLALASCAAPACPTRGGADERLAEMNFRILQPLVSFSFYQKPGNTVYM